MLWKQLSKDQFALDYDRPILSFYAVWRSFPLSSLAIKIRSSRLTKPSEWQFQDSLLMQEFFANSWGTSLSIINSHMDLINLWIDSSLRSQTVSNNQFRVSSEDSTWLKASIWSRFARSWSWPRWPSSIRNLPKWQLLRIQCLRNWSKIPISQNISWRSFGWIQKLFPWWSYLPQSLCLEEIRKWWRRSQI